ncbi:MAG TPA: ATP-binding cassette domain-containing protein [Sulfurospirillum arcachonense]|nr:ATP-binding cassette domain-containing protein [Sulfurimonas autotrophica]HIP44029.1 ATP-binding cassette domain-containing protein [Sulfurospirillum arcachonense]
MNLLSAKNLSHTFEYELFCDVSLSLGTKESIAIIGMSGSGKSTLLHLLSTLLTPQKGSIALFGQDTSSMSKKELSLIKRNKLGIVFQSHYLFKGFSAYENLEVAEILSQKTIEPTLVKNLAIEQCMHQKVTELSGGQQQRVSIARVLTKKPSIIFADEPTGNLDNQTATEVMKLFFDYCEQNSAGMILVTHDNDLAHMCKRVYKLENRELKQIK